MWRKLVLGIAISFSFISSSSAQITGNHAIHAHYTYDHDSLVYLYNTEDSVKYYSIENLGENINSAHLESGPRISPDGRTLYFFRAGHPDNIVPRNQDIWVSHLLDDDSTWAKAIHLKSLNNHDDNGVHWISTDGKRVILLNEYKKNGTSKNGVSMSEHTGNGDHDWSFPTKLKIKGYYNDERCSFYMTADENVLIMAIHHKESIGHQDLFVSFKEKKGKKTRWSKPINMGPTINTEKSEATAFIHPDGKTMYFSSNGRTDKDTVGGFDIYKTTRLDSTWTKWSEPENLGAPFNTPDDEFYFSTPASSDYAYLAHHFLGPDSLPHSDIVRIKLHEEHKAEPVLLVLGKVRNALDSIPIHANVTVRELPAKTDVARSHSDPDDGFKVTLPGGPVYEFFIEADGYLPNQVIVSAEDVEDFEEREMDIYLQPLKQDISFDIQNIFFAYNKSDLLPDSYPELNKLVDIMKGAKNITVEISAHTDARGSDSYNKTLSQKRAQSVVDYLVKNGIPVKQFVAKGYGEEKIRNHCKNRVKCTDDEHMYNRRVEFKILNVD